MKVKIAVLKDEMSELDQFIATSDFRSISFAGSSVARIVAHVKGAVLHCLGDFEHPPDVIEFEVERK